MSKPPTPFESTNVSVAMGWNDPTIFMQSSTYRKRITPDDLFQRAVMQPLQPRRAAGSSQAKTTVAAILQRDDLDPMFLRQQRPIAAAVMAGEGRDWWRKLPPQIQVVDPRNPRMTFETNNLRGRNSTQFSPLAAIRAGRAI